MDAICRFCLFNTREDGEDVLMSLCDCKGSMKYIHLQCLLEWRRTTDNDEWVNTCQLCLEHYRLPTRLPLEVLTNPNNTLLWPLFARSYIWTISAYYVYCLCLTFSTKTITVYPTPMYDEYLQQNQIIERQQIHLVINPYTLNYICTAITACYTLFYIPYIISIRNLAIYITYWAQDIHQPFVWNPSTAFLISLLSFVFMPSLPILCIVYIYMLPQYLVTHYAILNQMNEDAQLF